VWIDVQRVACVAHGDCSWCAEYAVSCVNASTSCGEGVATSVSACPTTTMATTTTTLPVVSSNAQQSSGRMASGVPTWLIPVAAVVGAVLLCCIMWVLVYLLLRSRKQRRVSARVDAFAFAMAVVFVRPMKDKRTQ
jgi:hypothetical protein